MAGRHGEYVVELARDEQQSSDSNTAHQKLGSTDGRNSIGAAPQAMVLSERKHAEVSGEAQKGSGNIVRAESRGYPWQAYAALLACVAQTVSAIVLMRYSRIANIPSDPSAPPPKQYLTTTAMVMAEVIKFFMSLGLVFNENHRDFHATQVSLVTSLMNRPLEFLKAGVPGLLYALQNNLIYIALSNLSAATYQISYQLKILTTALLSMMILHRRYNAIKWLALLVLTAGVSLISIATEETKQPLVDTAGSQSFLLGMAAVLCACVTSGLAGVYLEKILKDSEVSLWMRNVQLALYGMGFGLLGTYWKDAAAIKADGFFQGYNRVVWTVILLQSAGGIIIAVVLKYADNILKCFANAMAIVLSVLASYYLFREININFLFISGACMVLGATLTYTLDNLCVRLWRTYILR